MNEKEFVHNRRLRSDYEAMKRLKGDMVAWKVVSQGKMPPDKYQVTFTIRAMTTAGEARSHVVEIDCSSLEYPKARPALKFITNAVKHPHVFNGGVICIGGFPLGESLAELCIRMCRMLQYDPEVIDAHSIATAEYYTWYLQNRSQLPMDTSPLPTLGEGIELGQIRKSAAEGSPGGMQIKNIRRPGSPT